MVYKCGLEKAIGLIFWSKNPIYIIKLNNFNANSNMKPNPIPKFPTTYIQRLHRQLSQGKTTIHTKELVAIQILATNMEDPPCFKKDH